jgi:hypothetical protein
MTLVAMFTRQPYEPNSSPSPPSWSPCPMTDDILEYARQLATQPKTKMTYLEYELVIPEDTHWELVKLAADLKMHHEDYALNVLIGHVEQELDRKANHSG